MRNPSLLVYQAFCAAYSFVRFFFVAGYKKRLGVRNPAVFELQENCLHRSSFDPFLNKISGYSKLEPRAGNMVKWLKLKLYLSDRKGKLLGKVCF